jgi:hypothetical protein
MTRRLSFALSIVVLGVVAARAPPQAEGPTLTPLWELKGDFAAPESAYYHAASNSVFVSSINGQILDKDGNGYISRLSPDGKVVSAKWATGLNAPKGLRSVGNTLWVTGSTKSSGWTSPAARSRRGSRSGRHIPQRSGHRARRHHLHLRLERPAHLCDQGRQVRGVRRSADVVEQPNGLLVVARG